MTKCTACGKFASSADGVKCNECGCFYDKVCVKIPKNVKNSNNWLCPICTSKMPRRDNTETPVKGCSPALSESDSMGNVVEELKLFRTEMVNEMSELKKEILGLSNRMNKLFDTVEGLTSRLDTVEEKIIALEEHRSINTCNHDEDIANTVSQLKSELNDREQESLLTDIEISGLTECDNENLVHLVTLVASKLSITINENDIVYVQRMGPPRSHSSEDLKPSPRPVAVRLARRSLRDEFIKGARVRRGADTSGFNLPGPIRKLYVNERLTRTNRQLFRKARDEGAKRSWRFVWTRDGRIYARKQSGSPAMRIKMDSDIASVFGIA
ncbi:unnamed protein product [Colias eurytheme]|nr:unnamed protein product [Colias eurytheme]